VLAARPAAGPLRGDSERLLRGAARALRKIPARNATFLNVSYACPEPVLVKKRSDLDTYINGAKMAFLYHSPWQSVHTHSSSPAQNGKCVAQLFISLRFLFCASWQMIEFHTTRKWQSKTGSGQT
jgi:hypothetical protein